MKKMIIVFTDSAAEKEQDSKTENASYLDDLYRVGPDKPLGYLPLSTIEQCGIAASDLQTQLEEQGLKTFMVADKDCRTASGALYAWDEQALQALLTSRADILLAAQWPCEPAKFVQRVIDEVAPSAAPLFDLIADAFADKNNPWRSDKSSDPPGVNLDQSLIRTL